MSWPFWVLDGAFLAALVWWMWTRQNRAPKPRPTEPHLTPADSGSTPLPVQRIRFHANSARLSVPAIADLDLLAFWMKTNRAVIELTGSADDTGNPTQNRRVAQSRTAVALRALLAHGIEARRLVSRTLEPQRGRTEADRDNLRCVTFRETGTLEG